MFIKFFSAIIIFSINISISQALTLREVNSSKHLRFLNFPANPTHNKEFVHASCDLTGVGWHTGNTNRQLTMVSPIHFVGANHFRPGVGATIRFLCPDGVIKNCTVASQTAIPNSAGVASDLFIGTLTAPIPESEGIKYYPYLNLSNELEYHDLPLIILGRAIRGGKGTLERIRNIASSSTNSTRTLTFLYDTTGGKESDCYFQGGDSGSPIFIEHGGVAAIVGTNSLRLQRVGAIENFANFIPNYIEELNTKMEVSGYRMTKAIPGSTSLVLDHSKPVIVRAGQDFDIQLHLKNSGPDLAENVKLKNTLPDTVKVISATGADWFNEASNLDGIIDARRVKIDSEETVDYTISLNISKPGTYMHEVTFYSDQSPVVTQSFMIIVTDSYLNWATELTNASISNDDDQDGISNLLEYAFGGNPENSSQYLENSIIHILPQYTINDGVHQISFLRRTNYIELGISYILTSSTDLTPGGFSDASSMIGEEKVNWINDDIEQVNLTLTAPESRQFFSIEVVLTGFD